jgi:tryptophan synthase beta chain
VKEGLVEARAYNQVEALHAAAQFIQAEGIIPAPETAHALKCIIDEALRCKKTGKEETLLMLMSGHGFFDMAAYEGYLEEKLPPFELPQSRINKTINSLKTLYPFV